MLNPIEVFPPAVVNAKPLLAPLGTVTEIDDSEPVGVAIMPPNDIETYGEPP